MARYFNIQYRLTKCLFVQPEVLLLGFICSEEGRKCDPKKTEQLRNWPSYKTCACISSHLAFCNYLREFFGPDYSAKTKPLREYLKKGADFGAYSTDIPAQEARKWLDEQLIEAVVLVKPDF